VYQMIYFHLSPTNNHPDLTFNLTTQGDGVVSENDFTTVMSGYLARLQASPHAAISMSSLGFSASPEHQLSDSMIEDTSDSRTSLKVVPHIL
jgi:hypothetical protein